MLLCYKVKDGPNTVVSTPLTLYFNLSLNVPIELTVHLYVYLVSEPSVNVADTVVLFISTTL